MWTWELTTAFDGVLTAAELQKCFEEEFRSAFENADFCDVGSTNIGEDSYTEKKPGCEKDNLGYKDFAGRVSFWPLVSFNASDGRKHRYLVAFPDESLLCYRKHYDRCLPRQVALYFIADKILRGEWEDFCDEKQESHCCFAVNNDADGANASVASIPLDGNLMLVALWKNILYIIVFAKGRLCHWSEESGYGDCFDEHCQNRVERFRTFLKNDEFFSDVKVLGEAFVQCDGLANMDNLFYGVTRDSFWRRLDLDACETMKACKKRRWSFLIVFLAALCCFLSLMNKNLFKIFGENGMQKDDVAFVLPVELTPPSERDLEMLAWADGHANMDLARRHVWRTDSLNFVEQGNNRIPQKRCGTLDFKLLGIVGARAILAESPAGVTRTLKKDDLLMSYRVVKIGRNDVVLRCGRREVRYEVGAR